MDTESITSNQINSPADNISNTTAAVSTNCHNGFADAIEIPVVSELMDRTLIEYDATPSNAQGTISISLPR
jgi:hypothetical protein